jgi:prophage DNA circulation protein
MASKVAGAAKGGIRAWLMPELNDIKVQLAEIKGDIKSLQTQVNGMDKRVTGEIQGVKDSLNIVQRLAVLEAKVKERDTKSG